MDSSTIIKQKAKKKKTGNILKQDWNSLFANTDGFPTFVLRPGLRRESEKQYPEICSTGVRAMKQARFQIARDSKGKS